MNPLSLLGSIPTTGKCLFNVFQCLGVYLYIISIHKINSHNGPIRFRTLCSKSDNFARVAGPPPVPLAARAAFLKRYQLKENITPHSRQP
ncbi:jg17494 [Pararge aegeria aegeria]|uniref:Jg17494 protein n=1 Tax=Pararge aegeria aegeria TaxID=348720 RepID=A0A8S4RLT8_9NEOP|nr:jg17494 [Pararge aegeria aegeria]